MTEPDYLDTIRPEQVTEALSKLTSLAQAYKQHGLYREAMVCVVQILRICGVDLEDQAPTRESTIPDRGQA